MSTKEAETQKTGVAELDVEYTPPEKLSLGKKILYHLWDADQHLKSPQVCQIESSTFSIDSQGLGTGAREKA